MRVREQLAGAWRVLQQRLSPATEERDLLRACRGDDGQAERLVAYELERAPGITRREACERAIQRLYRDR